MKDRLDKFISNNGGLSRSEARIAIKSKIVTVNGQVISAQNYKVSADDSVYVLNREIEVFSERYLAFYKPKEVVCSNKDEEHETVIDLIADYDDEELKIAGRLDKDTTGLVLLSTDGKWIHQVTSPNYNCVKKYVIETVDPINPDLVEQFSTGILLKDSSKPTAPATLTLLTENTATLELTEGRYHQVKRMFGACGNKVASLHRESIGNVTLNDLKLGETRELTVDEVAYFSTKK